jgi:hypothetical protein
MGARRMADICRRVVDTGLNLSVMVVIGLGGRSGSSLSVLDFLTLLKEPAI